jgi:hypothetical protein
MLKTKLFFGASLACILAVAASANAFAESKEYVISINNTLEGASLSDHSFTFELQDPTNDNAVLQTKVSSDALVNFDPIILDDQDDASYFYRVVIKDTGEAGMTYDKQDAYVRIAPKSNLIAYQKDNNYQYDPNEWTYHPYHATDEELQGEAYADFNTKTRSLTFFRAEPGAYSAEKCEASNDCVFNGYVYDSYLADDAPEVHFYYSGFEKPSNFSILDLRIRRLATSLVFKDAIRPEGDMRGWFAEYTELKTADIKKLDTSRATSFQSFFYNCPKIENVDISTISFESFNRSGGSLLSIFRGTNVDQIDFRFFADPNDENGGLLNLGQRNLLDAFGLANTRYLNTSNYDTDDSSAVFSLTKCLEKIVVGEKYGFYNSGMFNQEKWLKVETGEVKPLRSMIRGTRPYHPEGAGTYIYPNCGTDPVTFANSYKKPSVSPDDAKNPDTYDSLGAAILIAAISIITSTFVVLNKTKKAKR